jgi:hypothetical protein
MRIQKVLSIIALGFFLANAEQDPLTNALIGNFTMEWGANPSLCILALKYKGEGKDDLALKQLLSGAPNDTARERYKIAKTRPNDDFWKLMATAGAVPVPPAMTIDCEVDLSNVLDVHLAARPQDLGQAATDSDTNVFLALRDLLYRIPAGGFPAAGGAPAVTQLGAEHVYRNCFSDPTNVFDMVKRKLGQTP